MPSATPTIGDSVALKAVYGNLARFQSATGKVRRIDDCKGASIALVEFALEESSHLVNVPLPYLTIVKSPSRRGVLNLHSPKDTRSEAERQAEGVAWLEKHGYTVLLIGQGRKGSSCSKCGQWNVPTGYVGNSPGNPDTLVTHDKYPEGVGLLQEWKNGENGERRKEQAELEARKRIVVVWNLPSMMKALWRFERRILPLAACSVDVQTWLSDRGLLDDKD